MTADNVWNLDEQSVRTLAELIRWWMPLRGSDAGGGGHVGHGLGIALRRAKVTQNAVGEHPAVGVLATRDTEADEWEFDYSETHWLANADGTTPHEDDEVWVTAVPSENYGRLWLVIGGSPVRRCCLAEDHPGCGTPFKIKLGTWDPATDSWDYDTTEEQALYDDAEYQWKHYGVDYFYGEGFSYPAAGATGNFEPRPSDTYGTLWHVLGNMSCDADNCGGCGGSS